VFFDGCDFILRDSGFVQQIIRVRRALRARGSIQALGFFTGGLKLIQIIKFIFPLLILIFPLSANAGQIQDIFGEGIFGVKWGASLEKVKSQFPEGKSSSKYGVLRYKIKDGRKLFGLERSTSDTITFSFDTNGMFIAIGIDFQYNSTKSYGELLHKLRTTFGESKSKPNSVGVTQVIWPEDAGIKISLTTIPGVFGGIDYLLFGVERNNKPQPTRKEDLGF